MSPLKAYYVLATTEERAMKILNLMLVVALAIGVSFVCAADEITDKLKAKTESLLKIKVTSVSKSPVEGLYEIISNRGLLYASADGRFVMQGTIYDMDDKNRNITEQSIAKTRVSKLLQYSDSMIVFPAKNEKYQITVFTDINCGYCRKLHSQIAQYNELGITVRYLAYPRGGERSSTWQQMQSVWCSKDQQQAMTDSKAGQEIALAQCENPVQKHYRLGIEFGVNGTPAILLGDGTMIPGYKAPDILSEILITRS